MELLKSLNEYPFWAKALVGLSVAVVGWTVVKALPESDTVDPKDLRTVLTINEINLVPVSPDAEVQVFAIVNGTEFRYPGPNWDSWGKPGATSQASFQLPEADEYELRFEMNVKTAATPQQRLEGEDVIRTGKTLESGEYDLYPAAGTGRSAVTRASVEFSLEAAPPVD